MESTINEYAFKVSFIGDYAVGKTSLIKRYLTNSFDEGYKATLGAAISTFKTTINETEVNLQVWDLAGQTSFRRVRVQYLFGSDFASNSNYVVLFYLMEERNVSNEITCEVLD